MVRVTRELQILADYHQFYVDGDGVRGDVSRLWSAQAVRDGAISLPGHLTIGTWGNRRLAVTVTIAEGEPQLAEGEWQRILGTGITLTTDALVVAGCSDYYPDAERIAIGPGSYAVLVASRGLATASEHHVLYLWPGRDSGEVAVVKPAALSIDG